MKTTAHTNPSTFPHISGYSILEQLYAGSRTIVYRAFQELEQIPVVIKVLKQTYPSFSELVQFRNQYTITKNLNIPGIVRSLSLESYQNGYFFVMEDCGSISLGEYYQQQPLTFITVLEIAGQIADILHHLHQNRVIHKDIKPANILIHPETKQVKLIDFSIASLLPKETQDIQNPNVLEGTLAYLAPEQTGRMNRGIDYRADFYSLGVTLYELLTGQLPFPSDDPLELVHSHMAKNPVPLHQINPNIPPVLSAIILKLMAKNAEERYQSALGLKHDLHQCLRQWEETGTIIEFELGQQDRSDHFLIPEKLYGRELEVKTLLEGFDRVACPEDNRVANGTSELMLVAGFSGIGKTAVVNEVHKPIVRQRGYFIKGKFDQFNRNIPFSAFVQAFRDLIGQLWSENDRELQQWRTKILQALGENAQVIIEVIPELEQIIGKQPPVTELTGSAAQNRFNLLFSKFLKVFTTKEHPLVIFLDDLQWADLASLKLMQLLMSEGEIRYLFLIGAYRDNEVSPVHPLIQTVDEMQRAGVKIQTITLSPLKKTDVNQLITDTLNCQPELVTPLTDLVYIKTKGNPFFTTQLLKSLYEDGLIAFKPPSVSPLKGGSEGGWECDIAQVRTLTLTDDVVEFMALQLQKLATETQNVLKLAACIGNQFDLETLAIVYQKSVTETASDLWKALQEGLILPQSEVYKFFLSQEQELVGGNQVPSRNEVLTTNQPVNYRFLHDRVQQAAYSLIPQAEKEVTHLIIGKKLLEKLSDKQREEQIFEIVNHLSIANNLISTNREREELGSLALIAGEKAKAATAYHGAIDYFNIGIDLILDSPWERNYELNLRLHEQGAEAAYLCGDFRQMDRCISQVLQYAKSIQDRVNIYEIMIQGYIAQNNLSKALETTVSTLQILGVEFPKNPTQEDVKHHLKTFHNQFMRDDIGQFSSPNKQMQDRSHLAQIRILASAVSAAYQSASPLLTFFITKQVELSVQFGNAPISAFSYIWYSLLISGILEDIDSSFRIGQFSLMLLSTMPNKAINAKVLNMAYAFIQIWKRPVRDSLQPLIEGYQSGLETGDLEYAAYGAYNHCGLAYCAGMELESLKDEMEDYGAAIEQFKQETALNFHRIFWQSVLNWLKPIEYPECLSGEVYNEAEMLPLHKLNNDHYSICTLYINKLILAYVFEKYQQAREYAVIAEEYAPAVAGSFKFSLIYFYGSLAQLTAYSSLKLSEKQALLETVATYQNKLKSWANKAPMNFLHKFYLVEAERYRILGEKLLAMENYDRAIAGAQENGYTQEEALANELAAKFYLDWGKEKLAQSYMIEAYYCYFRWGAKAKIADLEKRYPQLLTPILQQKNREITNQETIGAWGTVTSSSSGKNILLDFASVIKAAQAISSEIELEKLLATLMEIVIANAGAQTGSLILHKEEQWLVLASANQEPTEVVEIPLEQCQDLPQSLIYSVARSQELGVFDNLSSGNQFAGDPYIITHQPKSVLCTPISKQGKVIGILYLENNLTEGAFTRDRIETLQLLTAQAAISLENANLYQQIEKYSQNLEEEVAVKTQDLRQKALDLEQTLKNLQETQAQLIHSEKMSSLGQLVAGIAHEINNPINFIIGNLAHTEVYVRNILTVIKLYQEEYSPPTAKIQEKIEEIELEFIWEDLKKILESMKLGSERISKIILSLRNFSRLDESEMKAVDLHQGIESTLMILESRRKGIANKPQVQIIKKYGKLPNVTCYASQLNQVFLSLITNAIDALQDSDNLVKNPQIIISSEVRENHSVRISISDNGLGIPTNIQSRIFDPFFTTKTVGKGTGLGLAVSYAIVKKHGGKLTYHSTVGEGTEFSLEIPIQ